LGIQVDELLTALRERTRDEGIIIPGIIGQKGTKRDVLSAILAGRHIIIKGYPGVGKTTLARTIAGILPSVKAVEGCPYHCDPERPVCPLCCSREGKATVNKVTGAERFIRVQGSPDLQAEDLLGDIDPVKAMKYGPTDPRAFTPGKLLKANRGVLFFDELNRCPERLQNALLQVLEEGVATLGGYDVDYPARFILIATMNPSEYVGTEKLSEVLLDRFDTTTMTYPATVKDERTIVQERGKSVEGIAVPDDLLALMIAIVRATRDHKDIERPAGVRASIGLYERAQTNAMLQGRDTVIQQDVLDVVESVLAHRIHLSGRVSHVKSPEEILRDIVDTALREAKKKRA